MVQTLWNPPILLSSLPCRKWNPFLSLQRPDSLLKRSNMNTFVAMHKAEYIGEWFCGTQVSIPKVILASQDAPFNKSCNRATIQIWGSNWDFAHVRWEHYISFLKHNSEQRTDDTDTMWRFQSVVCLYFHTSTSVSWSFILTLRRIIVQVVQEDNGHEVIESIMWPVAVQDQEQKTEQLFKEIVKVPEYRVKLWDFRRQ